MWKTAAATAKELLFPKRCFFCKEYDGLLCGDCQALLEINPAHRPDNSKKHLADIYAACSYENTRVKKLLHSFKYKPFNKELAAPLASLVAGHFSLSEKNPDFNDTVLVCVPLAPKRLRWRGFNQAQAIAKELADIWHIPIEPDCLARTRETKIQADLAQTERRENIKGAFICRNNTRIKNKSVLLVDDVVTTGATMEECARVLSKNGAAKIIGIAVARTEKS
jgi:ComF family protein